LSWTKTWTYQTSKNDIRGIPLRVLADKPPKETNKPGLFRLTVFNPTDSTSYKILVTERDIDAICRIVQKGLSFTFDDNEPWANVIEFVPAGEYRDDKRAG